VQARKLNHFIDHGLIQPARPASDVAALLNIMERVNLGKLVAESKYQSMPEAFQETGGDRDQMLKLIVRKDREHAVIALAEQLASHYELPAENVISVFTFMIATTVDIETSNLSLSWSALMRFLSS